MRPVIHDSALHGLHHRPQQRFRLMRTRHSGTPIEHEERHALDAGPTRFTVPSQYCGPVVLGSEVGSYRRVIETRPGTDPGKHGEIREHCAFLEKGAKQALHNLVLSPMPGTKHYEPVRVHRVRLHRYGIEREIDAKFPSYLHLVRIIALGAGSVSLLEVSLTRDPQNRQIGIQLIRQPVHDWTLTGGRLLDVAIERNLKAALRDVTPGSDDVRDDFDGEFAIDVHFSPWIMATAVDYWRYFR
jgi:hypothetical protein